MSNEPPIASTSSIHKNQEIDEIDKEEDLLDELDELDNEFDLGGFRERRMEEFRLQMKENEKLRESNYGKYNEIKNEKDLIQISAEANRSIIHFFHRDFKRCQIMDTHLQKLAIKYPTTLFLKVEVSNVPFLVEKMQVKVLPCLVGFIKGVSKMKIVGFEELEGGDEFTTASLELTMLQCEVLTKSTGTQKPLIRNKDNLDMNRSRMSRGIRSSNKEILSDSD